MKVTPQEQASNTLIVGNPILYEFIKELCSELNTNTKYPTSEYEACVAWHRRDALETFINSIEYLNNSFCEKQTNNEPEQQFK